MDTTRSEISLTFSVDRLADVFAGAQRASEFALGLGFSSRAAWEVAIAVSELGTNVMRHADGGSLALRVVTVPAPGLEIVAEDDGPGIEDLDSAMIDDFSDGRLLAGNVPPTQREGLGSGLGAVRRLTDDLRIESRPGLGTTVSAFKRLAEPPGGRAAVESVKPVLILGLGNAILSDDGVGIHVARLIAKSSPGPHVVVKEAEVAGFALLDLLRGFDRAVVVDGVRVRGAAPGEVVLFASERLGPSLHLVAGHQIDLPVALEMGRALGLHIPSVVHIVGVQVEDDSTFAESCTDAVAAALPEAACVALRIAAAGC